MSLEKKYKEIKRKFKLDVNDVIGKEFLKYKIDYLIGNGTKGIVFHGIRDFGFNAAIKLIPNDKIDEEGNKVMSNEYEVFLANHNEDNIIIIGRIPINKEYYTLIKLHLNEEM